MEPEPEAPTEALGAAWAACLAEWSDEKRHDALLQLVAGAGTYAWAAGRYRARLAAAPEDALAQRRLDRVSRAAMATMFAAQTARPDKAPGPYRATITVLVMFIIIIIVGLIYAYVTAQRGAAPDEPGTRIPATPLKSN